MATPKKQQPIITPETLDAIDRQRQELADIESEKAKNDEKIRAARAQIQALESELSDLDQHLENHPVEFGEGGSLDLSTAEQHAQVATKLKYAQKALKELERESSRSYGFGVLGNQREAVRSRQRQAIRELARHYLAEKPETVIRACAYLSFSQNGDLSPKIESALCQTTATQRDTLRQQVADLIRSDLQAAGAGDHFDDIPLKNPNIAESNRTL